MAKRAQPERTLQKCVAVVLRRQYPKLLWWHVPNGSRATVAYRRTLADMGLRPGVPDIAMILPNGVAAFIELKAPGGSLSDAQIRFAEAAEGLGARFAVCRSLEQVQGIMRVWTQMREAAPQEGTQ